MGVIIGSVIGLIISWLILNIIIIQLLLKPIIIIHYNLYYWISAKLLEYIMLIIIYLMKITNNKYSINIKCESLIKSSKNYLLISNHIASSDFFINCYVAYLFNSIFKLKFLMKKEIKYTPIGWICANNDMIFLSRNNREKDLYTIRENLERSKNKWILIYPEGTFTNKKSIELINKNIIFANNNGLPIYNNLLTPRTSGFKELYSNLFDDILSITIAFDKPYSTILGSSTNPTFWEIICNRNPVNIYVHLQQYPIIQTNPKKYLMNIWSDKNILLDYFNKHQRFPGKDILPNYKIFNFIQVIIITFVLIYIWLKLPIWLFIISILISIICTGGLIIYEKL